MKNNHNNPNQKTINKKQFKNSIVQYVAQFEK